MSRIVSSRWRAAVGAATVGLLVLVTGCAEQLPRGGGQLRPGPALSAPGSTTPVSPAPTRAGTDTPPARPSNADPTGPTGPTPGATTGHVPSATPFGSPGPPSRTPPGSPEPPSQPPSEPPSEPPSGTSTAPPPPAGSDPFTGRDVVAYYGAAGTSSLGVLGQGTPARAWARLNAQARPFDAPGRPAIRCFELLATVASGTPGPSGDYRNRVGTASIEPYLRTVRAGGGILLLDIQPGRSSFLDEAEALRPLLEQPDVGLALDPEWRMGPGQVPGKVIGSVDAAEVNAVSAWLDALTAARGLPGKLFVVHQFTDSEIRGEDDLAVRPHLHEILNVDGFGPVAAKLAVYRHLTGRSPFGMGLKLFYRQDPVLMTPGSVLALAPRPQLVDYE